MNINLERTGLLSDGMYLVKIESVEEKPGQSGFPYLNMTFIVYASGRPTETKLFDRVSMSPKARFMLDAFLDAMEAPENGKVSTRTLRGKKLYVQVGRTTYEGKTRNEVTGYITPATAEKVLEVDVDLGNDWDSDPVDDDDEEEDVMKAFTPSTSASDDDEDGSGVATLPGELDDTEEIPY